MNTMEDLEEMDLGVIISHLVGQFPDICLVLKYLDSKSTQDGEKN
jgi:hypothetical protein